MEAQLHRLSEAHEQEKKVSEEHAKGRWRSMRTLVRRSTSGTSSLSLCRLEEQLRRTVQVLRQRPDQRSNEDIELIYRWIASQTSANSLFSGISKAIGKGLCREMEYFKASPGQVILHQGDIGTCCFLLISGVADVYIRDAATQLRYERRRDEWMKKHSTPYDPLLVEHGRKVAQLRAGATFGELSLLDPNSKRSATIIAEDVLGAELIQLQDTAYNRISKSPHIALTDPIGFLEQLTIFKSWSRGHLARIAGAIKVFHIQPAQYIQRKDQELEYLMIIMSGEAREVETIATDSMKLTAQVTFLGPNDVIGARLVTRAKKAILVPIDSRAQDEMTIIGLHKDFVRSIILNSGFDYTARTISILKGVARSRSIWRQTRLDQIKRYPHFHVQVTRKMMRLSKNICMLCGRTSHVAGDSLCIVHHKKPTTLLKTRIAIAQEPTAPRVEAETSRDLLTECWGNYSKGRRPPTRPRTAAPKVSKSFDIRAIRNSWPYRFISFYE